jgi:cobalt/nickel transport system permease protein
MDAINICRLSWGPLEIGTSRASLAQALNLLAKSLAAVSCLSFLALTTPMVQIIYICRRIKIPTVIIDLMVLVYFNIFVFLAKAEEIHTAQLSRCGYRGFRGSIKSLSLLGASLFVKGLKTSRESFDCMQARCFSGQYRVIEDAYYPNPKNLAAILGFDLLLIAVHLFLNFEF